MSGVTPGLRGLLGRLQAYVVDWKFSFVPTENVEYEPGIDREVADLADANIVSSELKSWRISSDQRFARHAIILDIDYPAYVIDSSTPGHHHVYLDVPGGVKHDDYMELLALLGRIGVVEKGYAEVSIKRGHSDLRVPWVHKSDQKLATAEEMSIAMNRDEHYTPPDLHPIDLNVDPWDQPLPPL